MASILGKTARWPAYDERVKNHRRRRRRRRHHRRRRRPRRYDIIIIIIIIIIFIVIVSSEQHQNEYLVVSSLSFRLKGCLSVGTHAAQITKKHQRRFTSCW